MLRIFTLLFWIVSGVAAIAEPLSILPLDAHQNWQAIGRVNTKGYRIRQMCTGALIAPNKVLTAAHCVAGLDGASPQPDRLTFVAGWLRGEAADSVAAREIWVHPNAYANGRLNIAYDIALLTLARDATVAPLPVTTDLQDPFALIGYTTRRPHMLSAEFSCAGAHESGYLQLECPLLPGHAGGPILAKTADGWAVAAVASTMSNAGALGVPISRLLVR